MSRTIISYQKQQEIVLCDIKPFKRSYQFPDKYIQEIKSCMSKNPQVQQHLKFIHYKFSDDGLRDTLIHQLYLTDSQQLQYFVPQLVYISIKKQCKPMKKFLLSKTKTNQNLCRLILWNLKAFTVLMKEKNAKIKQFVNQFEQQIQQNLGNDKIAHNKFTHAERAIEILTTASLKLKQFQKINPQKKYLEQKLKKFIKRFNAQYFNNLDHNIIIPFRKEKQEIYHSNYVVGIVLDQCSCFPTRKRVPYRIVIETINKEEIKSSQIRNQKKNQLKYQRIPPQQPDLYEEVLKVLGKQTVLFVVDKQQGNKLQELGKQLDKVKKQQLKKNRSIERKQTINLNLHGSVKRQIIDNKSHRSEEDKNNTLDQYKIKKNPNLQKFQKIYIPTIPAKQRQTLNEVKQRERKIRRQSIEDKERFSQAEKKSQSNTNIRIVEQVTNYEKKRAQNSVFGKQLFTDKIIRFKKLSSFQKLKSLKYHNVVVKGGDDLRQQIICMQLIYKMRDILKQAQSKVIIKPYQIIVLSENSGLLQFVANSISLDGLKKKKQEASLIQCFQDEFTQEAQFRRAKQNFIRSLAGSSILTYVLKLKDRHNGNILLDKDGNIIHIDFGFIFGMSPGAINFQTSPFKFTEQYLELLGGSDKADDYIQFRDLFTSGLQIIRKRSQQLCLILQIMMQASDLECFQKFQISNFRDCFKPHLSDSEYKQYCEGLVQRSCLNYRTYLYDEFQYRSNGILR